ncbi:hypothetical protein IFT48_05115 [Pseudomonas fluorescens]|uniref:DNA replication terminus site-binding protein n=1 Tax=Pseudomonas TaxID=286 RepID=UPI000F042301|nr:MULTISPECIES: DNA replication terminus site-binding protein [Pseudomonas]MBD8089356.1 hypothetical protein [Pseudomonas fluorescens]MBD8682129.1 hypothetical protein [Pseudomonas sp. CFBP 13719]
MEVFNLTEAYNDLKAAISKLNGSLSRPAADNRKAFVGTKNGLFLFGDDAIALASRAYEDIYYDFDEHLKAEAGRADEGPQNDSKAPEKTDGDGRETRIWLGGVPVEEHQLELAREVNRRKDLFQTAVHEARARVQMDKEGCANTVHRAFRDVLKKHHLGLVSLRQAYRHIPLLDDTPASIRFSFSSAGRSIKKVSPEQVLMLIEKKGLSGKKIEIIKKKLGKQSPDLELAQVQDLAGYYKANVLWPKPDDVDQEVRRLTIPVFLPILFLRSNDLSPSHQPYPPPAVKVERKQRRDRKLEMEPFIDTLRIYAYKTASVNNGVT